MQAILISLVRYMVVDVRHESLRVWNMKLSHTGYLDQVSFPTRGIQARVLSKNLRVLLNKNVGLAGLLLNDSTCRSGPSMCRLCRCVVQKCDEIQAVE